MFEVTARAAVRVVEGAGVLVTLAGLLLATLDALNQLRLGKRGRHLYNRYRVGLGRALLLGLEFLIAAEIINTTVIDQSLGRVASLAVVVLVRAFLSLVLESEIEGSWPWKRGQGLDADD